MKDDKTKLIKGYYLAAKLAKLNALISTTGAVVSTFVNDKPDIFSLLTLGINSYFLIYDDYKISELEKDTAEELEKSKVKIYTNTISNKSLY